MLFVQPKNSVKLESLHTLLAVEGDSKVSICWVMIKLQSISFFSRTERGTPTTPKSEHKSNTQFYKRTLFLYLYAHTRPPPFHRLKPTFPKRPLRPPERRFLYKRTALSCAACWDIKSFLRVLQPMLSIVFSFRLPRMYFLGAGWSGGVTEGHWGVRSGRL